MKEEDMIMIETIRVTENIDQEDMMSMMKGIEEIDMRDMKESTKEVTREIMKETTTEEHLSVIEETLEKYTQNDMSQETITKESIIQRRKSISVREEITVQIVTMSPETPLSINID